MSLQLHTRDIAHIAVIDAVGRLTLTDGQTKLRDLIHVQIANGSKKFLLNFERLEFIDSYGIGELARAYSIVRRAGGELKLTNLDWKILEILDISRLTTIFEIYPVESAALQSFNRR